MGKHARKIQPFLERVTQRSVPDDQAALAQHQVDQADCIINSLTFQTSREGVAWTARKRKEEARDVWVHAMQMLGHEIPDEALQEVGIYKERLKEFRPASCKPAKANACQQLACSFSAPALKHYTLPLC